MRLPEVWHEAWVETLAVKAKALASEFYARCKVGSLWGGRPGPKRFYWHEQWLQVLESPPRARYYVRTADLAYVSQNGNKPRLAQKWESLDFLEEDVWVLIPLVESKR